LTSFFLRSHHKKTRKTAPPSQKTSEKKFF